MNPATQRKIDQVKTEIDKQKEKFAGTDPKYKDADVQKKKLQGLQDVITRFKDQSAKADKTKENLGKMLSTDHPSQKAKKKGGMVMNKHAGELSTQHHHDPGPVHTATKTKTFGKFTKMDNHVQSKWTKGQAESVETNMENIEEGRYYNHHDNRTGFAKRHREDDEYHVPDPVDHRQEHEIHMKLSRDGGEIQHKKMKVKTLHGAEHAKKFAHETVRQQGWTVHESYVADLEEAKVAATATVRAGLAARGRKAPGEAEQAARKKEHDDAWERLMAHAAAQKAKKTNEEVELDEGIIGHAIAKAKDALARLDGDKSTNHAINYKRKQTFSKLKQQNQKQRTNEEVELDEARMSAAVKLQRAFQREQEKSAASRKRGEELLKKKEEPKKVNEANYSDSNKNAIKNLRPGMKTSFNDKDGREIHAHREGDKVHLIHHQIGAGTATKKTVPYSQFESFVIEGAYEKAEENKRSADAAKKQGDMFAHHLHMADHHDNMAQWHGEKGRHGEADRHAEKSEKHHEEAMKLKESVELDEAVKLGSKVKMHAPGKDYHDQVGHVGEIRHGAFKGAAKTYTVDYADGKSVQLGKKNIKLHTEEVATNNVGSGEIAGTKGDAGKKAVMTKEPLKRRLLSQFKTFIDKAEK